MKKIMAVLLAIALLAALAGCERKDPGHDVPPDSPVGPGEEQGGPDGPDDGKEPVTPPGPEDLPPVSADGLKLGLWDFAASLGAAGLAAGGEYDLRITDDPGPLLATGELDAAIVPVSAAARIYNETGGQIGIAAVTAAGGLGIVRRDATVRDIWDLAQRTVYVPEGDAEAAAVFGYIAEGYGFELGETLILEPAPAGELASHDIALMPAKQAGTAIVRDADVKVALKLGAEWSAVTEGALLPAGCLVVRNTLSGEETQALLEDLKESQNGVSGYLDYAVALGLAETQEEAWAALECCEFTWLTGADTVREELADYLSILFRLDPALLGGGIPDDGFYR